MALTFEDRRFLRDVHRKLKDEPLRPGSPFYEPIHPALDDADPVWLMRRHVELNDVQSMQLFSGFRGAGKTTELFRLKQDLELQGYVVLYADALDYVPASEPIEIGDLLMAMAGAFGDAIAEDGIAEIGPEGFWKRLENFVTRTELRISGVDAKSEIRSPGKEVIGGINAGLNIKAELRTVSTFRQNLRKFMAARLVDLKREADLFFEDGVKAIKAAKGADTQIVFIFDQLEQLRGTYETWKDVIRSVGQLFSVHIDRLRFPYVHTIYSVPPWLRFVEPPEAPVTMLPTVHLWINDVYRTPFAPGLDAFHRLIRRRLGEDGIATLFGPDGAAPGGPAERLIGACGGHVRDLLRLMREVVKRATELPVAGNILDSVINAAHRDLLPIAQYDAKWLHRIGRLRDTGLPNLDEKSIERLSNFLDTHRVIYFVNGSAWYDLHPLIRDDVARIAAEEGNPGNV